MRNALPCLTLILFIFGCSSKQLSPEDVAVDFFNVLYNEHDIEKAEKYCTPESREKLKSTIRAIEGAMQIVDGDDQSKYTYTVIAEQSKIEKDSALITVISSLDSLPMHLKLVNLDEGWKVDFNYQEPVIQKELIDEVLEIMKPYSDSITVEAK